MTPDPSTRAHADLVEHVCTLPAEVVLTRQNDHRLVEDLHADRTCQLLLQPCQSGLAFFPPAAVKPGQVTWQRHADVAALYLLDPESGESKQGYLRDTAGFLLTLMF